MKSRQNLLQVLDELTALLSRIRTPQHRNNQNQHSKNQTRQS